MRRTGKLVDLLEHLHDARVVDSRSKDDEKIVEKHGLFLEVVREGLGTGHVSAAPPPKA